MALQQQKQTIHVLVFDDISIWLEEIVFIFHIYDSLISDISDLLV